MIIRNSLLAIAAAGMALGSTAATAAPVAMDRSGSEIGASEELRGQGAFGLGIAALIVLGVLLIILGDDDEDAPTSP